MTYIEYISLPWKEQVKYKVSQSFANFGHGFVNFFISIGLFFANIGKKIWGVLVDAYQSFVFGDVWTKCSFLILGLSHIRRKQIVKGILLMAVEALFIFYIVAFGAYSLRGLVSLGETKLQYFISYDGVNIAPGFENAIFTTQAAAITFAQNFIPENAGADYVAPTMTISVFGDNSSLLLLFGILAVILVIAFVCYYFSTVRSSYRVQEYYEAKIHLPTFFESFKSLLDEKFYITLLLLPIIGICVFTILPVIDMATMAFTNYDGNHMYPASLFTWVGLANFYNLFAGYSGSGSNFSYTFFHILGWTLIWAFFATFLNYFLGMLVAMLINKKGIKLKKLWRTLFVLSIAMPQFISLLTWSKFLGSGGFIEMLLKQFGFMDSLDTLTIMDNANIARVIIIAINVWIGIPYTILQISGILMNIPADLYESAQIDGAKPSTSYFKITLPYILFVTGPYLITQFVGNINNFNVIYFLTGGRPLDLNYMNAGRTDLLVTWLYKLTTGASSSYNYAAVIGIMIFLISAVLSLIAYRHTSAVKNEENFA